MKNRFLIPEYIYFSIKLRVIQYYLKFTSSGLSPLEKHQPKFQYQDNDYPFRATDHYIALNYFTYSQALDFYGETDFTTTKIILALVYWNEKDRDEDHFLKLTEDIISRAKETDDKLSFVFNHPLKKYTFNPDRVSGIVQGKALSLLVRAYTLTKNTRYKVLAKKCLNTMLTPIEDKGPMRNINNDLLWVEEYANITRPSMVLNGHLFTIISIADYLNIENDKETYKQYKQLLNTTIAALPFYTHKGALLYSMFDWKVCNIQYLGLMQPLSEHIYQITGENKFLTFKKWLQKHSSDKLFQKLIS